LYASRVEGYRGAHVRIDAAGRPITEVVDRIVEALEHSSALVVSPGDNGTPPAARVD
jgi:hypothetical protein